MTAVTRPVARFLALAAIAVFVASCATQSHEALDARPRLMAPVRTIAIATISTRPSLASPLFTGHRGELIGVLSKYEYELTNALTNQGFNVIAVSNSGMIYNDNNLEYELAYLHNRPEFMVKTRGEDDVQAEARRLRASSNRLIGKVDDMTTFYESRDPVDQITSPNTRIFPEIGVNYRMTLPRYTGKGGTMDNRFMSDAARMAIGEITRDMGADAYLLIDGNLVLSARKEGYMLMGATGGSRYATFDGTAALVRNDGAIISVDWLRSEAGVPFGGSLQDRFTTERGSGIAGFHKPVDQYGLLEASYQAIRVAATDLAALYAEYRADGRKDMAKGK
ncbi:MAG: hypothetical protein WDO70_10205 [Alphaproteobacteria bacterium]